MKRPATLAALIAGLLLAVASPRPAHAAKVEDQIEARHRAAVSAYDAGDFDKMKSQLAKAVAMAKSAGLADKAIMARTYVLLGVLQIDGLDDRDGGIQSFTRALKIQPDIQIPPGMGTTPVKNAFKQAKSGSSASADAEPAPSSSKGEASGDDDKERAAIEEELDKPKGEKAEKPASKKRAAADDDSRDHDKQARQEWLDKERRERDLAEARDGEAKERSEKERLQRDKQDRERQLADEKARLQQVDRERDDLEKGKADSEKSLSETKRQLADLRDQLGDAKAKIGRVEKAKADVEKELADAHARITQLDRARADLENAKGTVEKQLADTKAADAKQLADSKAAGAKQAADSKAAGDKQLADSKGKTAQVEKAKADTDKQLADAKAKIAQLEKAKADTEKQLADSRAKTAQVEKAKADVEKTLADTRTTLQQVQRDKSDKEKQLADTRGREDKEREAKEKLERAKKWADTEDANRKYKEDKERTERARLADGPAFPSHVPEPVYCTVPDEAQGGVDLYVHCAVQSNVRMKELAFYYRPSGGVHFNAAIMERSAKGWYTTVIPASKVSGRLLQYYAEARDTHDDIVAANGKATSPNVLTLTQAGHAAGMTPQNRRPR